MIAKQLKIVIQQAVFCNGSSLTLAFQFYMKSFRISRNVHDYGLHGESFWRISRYTICFTDTNLGRKSSAPRDTFYR